MRLRQLLEQQGISPDHPESFNKPERGDQSPRLVIPIHHRHYDIFHQVGTNVAHAVQLPHGLWDTARHRLAHTDRAAQAPVVGADDAGEHQQKTPPLGRGREIPKIPAMESLLRERCSTDGADHLRRLACFDLLPQSAAEAEGSGKAEDRQGARNFLGVIIVNAVNTNA